MKLHQIGDKVAFIDGDRVTVGTIAAHRDDKSWIVDLPGHPALWCIKNDWQLMSVQDVAQRKPHPYDEQIARARARLDAMPPEERAQLVLQGSE